MINDLVSAVYSFFSIFNVSNIHESAWIPAENENLAFSMSPPPAS